MIQSTPPFASRRLVALAVGFFLFLLLPGLTGAYGLFIDELYYLACAARPALGYVDHPPLAPWILRVSRALLGVELGLRVPPALAGALTSFLTGFLAWRMGARPFGQLLAAGAMMTAPAYQALFGFYSMNAFEILLWVVGCSILVEIAIRDEPRLWLAFGLVAGVGLLNKHTFVLFGTAVAVAFLLTEMRRHLLTRWPYLGAASAALLVSPNLLWQMSHGWPSLEFYRNADLLKNVPTPPHEVLLMQILFMNPWTLPLWLGGAIFLLAGRTTRRYRQVGWTFVVLLATVMIAQKSRPDRIAGIYPVVLAAGAMGFELWTASSRRWLRGLMAAGLVVGFISLAPIGSPILPPDLAARYVTALGVVPQIESGEGKTAELPQWFADRFGWPKLAGEVNGLAASLRLEGRPADAIFTPSYGHAGALELYGDALPPVYSTHNNYFLWGPPNQPIDTAIVVGDSEEHLEQLFAHVERAMVHDCAPCMRWRDRMPIWIVSQPRPEIDWQQQWSRLKNFI